MAGKNKKIRITLIKSPISQKPGIRKTVSALGLRRMHASVTHEARPEIMGMIRTVAHMVRVEDMES